ncbi:type VII secretion-associated serine protease mycosin [Streptomyces fulvorobeus]
MQAEQMWETSTGEGVTVAVIDSGVDASNPDLLGQVLKGKDLAEDSPGDEHVDYDGHGTGMAGLVAGTGRSGGGDGAFGLAPGAKILPVRMTDDTGKVNGATGDKNFSDDVSVGIRFAADNGAKVISVSQGNEEGSQDISDAVKYALQKGSLVFAAVGNTGDKGNALEYPAATPGVVGVGSTGKNRQRAPASQYGSQVDLAAPGVDMVHACGNQKSGLCKSTGTSDATAIASASAALIWSQHPEWTNNQVLRVLLNTAGGPINGAERTDYIGHGIVRPRIALKTPGDPGPADVYPLPDLAAAEPARPAAEPSRAKGGSEADTTPAAAAPAADDSGDTGLWAGLGVGAAALVGGAVAFTVIRSRRRSAAPAAVPPYQQQPSYPDPAYGPPPGAPDGHSPYGGPRP